MDRASGDGRLATDAESDGLVSVSRELADVSFGAVLAMEGTSRIGWTTPDGLEIVGRGAASRFAATGPDRFAAIRSTAEECFGALDHEGPAESRPRAFGGFAFHDGHVPQPPWSGFGAATFVVPRVQLTRTDDGTWLTVVEGDAEAAAASLDRWADRLERLPAMRPIGSPPGVASVRPTASREEWTAGVRTALDRIDRGELEKVVLARAVSVEPNSPVDVPAVLERLRRRYPSCYRFLLDFGAGGTFFGAPPERLVSRRGRTVETEALAGSVPRGESPEVDDEHATRLLESGRLTREHGLVVEAIRDQLAPLATTVDVAERTVRRLATIQHLRTPIEARLDGDRHVLELVEALHPTPAVGGLPPATAWETIRRVEPFDRGWYAAPVGWFDADGDGEFAVAIRAGVVTDGAVTLYAGNGIVADSDPDEEWEEVQLKLRPILDELE